MHVRHHDGEHRLRSPLYSIVFRSDRLYTIPPPPTVGGHRGPRWSPPGPLGPLTSRLRALVDWSWACLQPLNEDRCRHHQQELKDPLSSPSTSKCHSEEQQFPE
ncbi:hypothetical protein KQX54_008253 [Cotesia glomerata]|uniref:Uncharacterized protein n=1 Tax=Cotesia glomerata TaxID=32391 RepID=A0AAV7IXQ1_COTGL|nr:hypothetical protein KQX54_008253 [Cotesia glomerata]